MNISIWVLLIGSVSIGIGTYLFSRYRKTKLLNVTDPLTLGNELLREVENSIAVELHFGVLADEPLISVSALPSDNLIDTARRLNADSSSLKRLSPLLQTIPSILTAVEFGKGNYMQVIVNGPLAAAKDGQTLLPFVKGSDGRVSAFDLPPVAVPSLS